MRKSEADPNALFVKSLTFGLRADNPGLIEKQPFTALSYTKEGRVYTERLIQSNPLAGDAYLGPGVENYLLSFKPAPLRVLLRITGSNVDREKGIEEMRQTCFTVITSNRLPGCCWPWRLRDNDPAVRELWGNCPGGFRITNSTRAR